MESKIYLPLKQQKNFLSGMLFSKSGVHLCGLRLKIGG
jgi:hypothetical protein